MLKKLQPPGLEHHVCVRYALQTVPETRRCVCLLSFTTRKLLPGNVEIYLQHTRQERHPCYIPHLLCACSVTKARRFIASSSQLARLKKCLSSVPQQLKYPRIATGELASNIRT